MDARAETSQPDRLERGFQLTPRWQVLIGGVVVVAMLATLWRSVAAERRLRAADDAAAARATHLDEKAAAERAATTSVPAEGPTGTAPGTVGGASTLLLLEVQVEVPWNKTGPGLSFRVRSHEGASRPFDVTTREEPARQKMRLSVNLPLAAPELPLRMEVVGATWCQPPGMTSFEVTRLDQPLRLMLVRSHVCELEVRAERTDDVGQPLAGVHLVHESGRELAVTDGAGQARIVRPIPAPRRTNAGRADLVIALADGFLPAPVDESGRSPVLLRSLAGAGRIEGRLLDPSGAAVGNAFITVRQNPFGSAPTDPTGRAIFELLRYSATRDVPALAVASRADGSFTVALYGPARVELAARHPVHGRVAATLSDTTAFAHPDGVAPVELRFPACFTLRAHTTMDSKPLASCSCELVQLDAGMPVTLAAATTDAEGVVQLAGPAIAPLYLVARPLKLAVQVVTVVADVERTVEVELPLEAGRALLFTVTGLSQAPEDKLGRLIEVRDGESGVVVGSLQPGPDGKGRIDHLPTGRHLALVLVDGAGSWVLKEGFLLEKEGPLPSPVDLGALTVPQR